MLRLHVVQGGAADVASVAGAGSLLMLGWSLILVYTKDFR
jgi:hypothetical protein